VRGDEQRHLTSVRGTPRDSLYTLDTLLNLDGGVKPEMVATDNASYSDMAPGVVVSSASCSEVKPTPPRLRRPDTIAMRS
jgi:hypothetical protein